LGPARLPHGQSGLLARGRVFSILDSFVYFRNVDAGPEGYEKPSRISAAVNAVI
jgi:hypothetical protein